MHIVIMGAGVIGVTSAWYLAKSGHKVTVIDRQPTVANETSFANAGQISPGYSSPWAAPGVPFKALKWLTQELAPLKINFKELDWNTLCWMKKMLGNCNAKDYKINKERMMRIAEYSRDTLRELRNETNIAYDNRSQGTLQVFRTQGQVVASQKDIEVLKSCGIEHQVLDLDGCIAAEPALFGSRDRLVGGLRLPNDETGNCHTFVTKLAAMCEQIGVEFMMDTQIQHIEKQGDEISAVYTDKGEIHADAYVMAMGSFSTEMLKTLDIRIPVYPIKGYSLTIAIDDPSKAPESTVMDETYKVAITRLGDKVRVGGTAEIASFNLSLDEKRRKNIECSVKDLFPHAGNIEQAEFWTGLRPMTPDSVPVLGKSKIQNLFLNTGHGTLGWTMSVGSAKFLTDIINNKQPDISPDGLSIQRYQA